MLLLLILLFCSASCYSYSRPPPPFPPPFPPPPFPPPLPTVFQLFPTSPVPLTPFLFFLLVSFFEILASRLGSLSFSLSLSLSLSVHPRDLNASRNRLSSPPWQILTRASLLKTLCSPTDCFPEAIQVVSQVLGTAFSLLPYRTLANLQLGS